MKLVVSKLMVAKAINPMYKNCVKKQLSYGKRASCYGSLRADRIKHAKNTDYGKHALIRAGLEDLEKDLKAAMNYEG